jgi:hypothetical protein
MAHMNDGGRLGRGSYHLPEYPIISRSAKRLLEMDINLVVLGRLTHTISDAEAAATSIHAPTWQYACAQLTVLGFYPGRALNS